MPSPLPQNPSPEPRSARVVGWYGKRNIGDESYKLALAEALPGWRLSFTDDARSAASHTAAPVTTTVLGGGDVVTPEAVAAMSAVPGDRVAFSVGISDAVQPERLRAFRHMVVRDARSLKLANEAGVPATLCPDVAFLLSGDRAAGRSMVAEWFSEYGLQRYEKLVTVVVNGHLLRDQTASQFVRFEHLAFDLARVADWTNASFVFAPFGCGQPWDDRAAGAYVASRAKFWNKNHVVHEAMSVRQSLDLIAASDAVVSTRLHASIFAAANGVPFVDVTHNHKNAALVDQLGVGGWQIPYGSFDSERAIALLADHLAGRSGAERLRLYSDAARVSIKKAVADVFDPR